VYNEMSEDSYDLIDRELLDLSERLIFSFSAMQKGIDPIDQTIDRYFVRISDSQGKDIYQSRLAKLITIHPKPGKTHFVVKIDISHEHLWIDPENMDDLGDLDGDSYLFRVLLTERIIDDQKLIITIAKPLPFVTGDLKEVREQIIFGSILAALLVICLSYLLAGRILAPLQAINAQIKDINQTSLSRRITIGKSQDELHELGLSLNSMFDRLEHSFEKQREFIGNAAHEIKTPITALLLGQENILNTALPQEIKDDLERQLNVLRRLSLLVKNLLDISRLEQQDNLHYDSIELSSLIKDVCSEFDAIISDLHITLTTNTHEVRFFGDKLKIQRMLINLIDNALKYNKKGGAIAVSLKRSGNSAVLEISNTGTQIPNTDIPMIFDQFYRVDKSHSSQVEGFGLGLTIVKKIIELHDGTIAVSSAHDETVFEITLPIRNVKPQ